MHPKKSFRSIWNLCVTATSWKKSERFHVQFFNKTWKTSFWTLLARNSSKTSFFKKKILLLLFKLDDALTSRKTENFYERFQKKNSAQTDKQTNGRRVFHRIYTSWVHEMSRKIVQIIRVFFTNFYNFWYEWLFKKFEDVMLAVTVLNKE